MSLQDLTQHELIGLKHRFNLSDGHCHQSQTDNTKAIVDRLPDLWYEAEQLKQHQLDELYLDTFFTHQNQRGALATPSLLTYASSISIVMTANYMMAKGYDATLMTPCFDNLADIFKSFNIPLAAIAENQFHDIDSIYDNLVVGCTTKALFIVDVNNPTGFSLIKLGKKAWEEIIRFCIDHDKLLIIDFCFAPLLNFDSECEVFDIYKLLIESGVTYISYEDTGKVRPTQDAKVSILKASMDIYPAINDIKTTYILNVSPFVLRFLIEFICDSERSNYSSTYNTIVTNKQLVDKYLSGTFLEVQEPHTYITVAWCKISLPGVKASNLKEFLTQWGVHVLPGTYFFWNDHSLGESYIRIALARNADVFEQSMAHLRIGLEKFESLYHQNKLTHE